MKHLMMLSGLLSYFSFAKAQTDQYARYPVTKNEQPGLSYTRERSVFRVWSPPATAMYLLVYQEGTGGKPIQEVTMHTGSNGTWWARLEGDWQGKFYTYQAEINGKRNLEATDPYARAVGINGQRAMVVDLAATNPPGWETDQSPAFGKKTDAIIYELHVRDASISASSGIRNRGKFTGLTETGTKNTAGLTTGLDHLRELGVTHVHLLPCFDFNSIDENNPEHAYNWGYDPLNYNVPEGSYATNAADGVTRIREFKQLVQAFHRNGLRVVMDVVYNHTALTETSGFNQLVPGYYYRQNKDGKFSNASACGNETASERPMFRKYILESMKYWVQEYHIDGFRIDLMGIHDIETMNLVSRELHRIKPDILLYGEGWTAGASPLPDSLRALKANAHRLDRIAVFSDDLRDGIKGSVFEHADKGFASGKPGMEESIKFGIAAGCPHPQVNYEKVNYSKKPYSREPHQTISYCECHDNHVLWDKMAISAAAATEAERISMHKLALSVVLTSQGIAFLHAGTEFLRSKKGVENSFESGDSINAIDWDQKTVHADVYNYVKGLISLRKAHPAFRLAKGKQVAAYLRFEQGAGDGLVAFTLDGRKAGDTWKKIRVYFNGTESVKEVRPDAGKWLAAVRDNQFANNKQVMGNVLLAPYSCTILYQQ